MRTNFRTLPNLAGLREAGKLRQDNLVQTECLFLNQDLPLLVRPRTGNLDLIAWAASSRVFLHELLLRHGGLLFRGFEISDLVGFERFVTAVSGDPLEYAEQTSPRSKLHGNIYTSTEYPPQHRIFLHNENSYSSTWPLKIMFFCLSPASAGGETPIADVRRILARIPARIHQRFTDKGWMLVRNFGTGFGLSWQTAFQTDDREAVVRHCDAAGIQYEWLSAGRLRLRQCRPAFARHPSTGQSVWFNHATFFHVSTLDAVVQAELLAELREEDLPYNSYYGDGTAIEPEVLSVLREAYEGEAVSFQWQKRDILLLDNMLVAHGRAPFSGPRQIVVGMSEPYSG